MRLIRFIDRLNDVVGTAASYMVYFVMGILVWEVLMRYAFDSPTVWAHESAEFFYGPHLMLGGAFALRWGAHVNVEVFYRRFSPRLRAILDLFTWTLFYGFVGVLLWKSGVFAWNAVANLEHSSSVWRPPIWPVKLTVPIAASLFLLQGFTKTIHDLYLAVKGRSLNA